MGLKFYLPVAVVVFLAATVGSDVVALMSIAGESFEVALREHVYWVGVEFAGTLLLLVPFIAVAFTSAHWESRAGQHVSALIFAIAMLALLYFYFQAYQAAQIAAQAKRWTAATLSIGLLPFLIGFPVVIAAWAAEAVASTFQRRASD